MRIFIISITLLGVSSAFAQQCPIGSFPSVDSWGNQICKTFGGATETIQGSLDTCPIGFHPWVDSWGNQVCQSFDSGTNAYDTSKGCPIGTTPWVDEWGNPICK